MKRLWQLSEFEIFADGETFAGHPVGKMVLDRDTSNGGAVFLSDMTETEYEEHVHMEERGWRGFYDKIFGHGRSKQA